MNPLKNLIENRGFDRYQVGLESRFGVLGYKLVYGETTSKTCMYMDFESKTLIGRITAWISGECELSVIDKEAGESVFFETHHFKSEREFLSGYPKLTNFMRESSNA